MENQFMQELLLTALPMAEMLIIKRDFDLLKKIALQMKPELQMQLTPYTALFCHAAIEYLNKKGNTAVDIEQTGKYSIKDIRQKAKFFDLSINKLLQSINNVDKLQNDEFINLMKYPELGKWNIHDNIGIWFDKQKNIVGNSHYAYYVFQDEKSISRPSDTMQGHELQGQEIKAFAYDMGRIIGSISSAFSSVSDFMIGDFNEKSILISSQDFNTNRCRVSGCEEYKTIRLFLLHVLSSIGFIIHILKKGIIRETGILLRLEYITYHYALRRLEGIKSYSQKNSKKINDVKLIEMLDSIDYSNNNKLRNSEFRNCMMHFSLVNKDNKPLIEESKLDLSIPFCGLVESQFNGLSYNEYKNKIENELLGISELLTQYLDFEFLLST